MLTTRTKQKLNELTGYVHLLCNIGILWTVVVNLNSWATTHALSLGHCYLEIIQYISYQEMQATFDKRSAPQFQISAVKVHQYIGDTALHVI